VKFRAVGSTDLVVSEIGFSPEASDPLDTQRLVRLAYDEGVTLLALPLSPRHDWAVAQALKGGLAGKLCLAATLAWPGAFAALESAVSSRLTALGADRLDVLLLQDVPADAVADGTVGDALHRLRAAGRVRVAGLSIDALAPDTVRVAERAGAAVIDVTLPSVDAIAPLDTVGVSVFVRPPIEAPEPLSFLWTETGRTRRQAPAALALAAASTAAVIATAVNDDGLREAARAALAPPLTAAEIAAARAPRALAGV